MADMQIPMPDGEQLNLPQWATEQTLQSLASVLRANNSSRDILINAVNAQTMDIDGLEQATQELSETTEEAARKRNTGVSKALKNVTRRFTNFSTSLDDTSKPLSKVHDMAEKFTGFLGDASEKGYKSNKMLQGAVDGMSGFWKGTAKAAGVIGDGFMAYAGFLAAKVEQYAVAQQTMIDSGAIFFDSAQRFEEIRLLSYEAGVGYQQMAETIQKFGKGIQSMGDGISGGSLEFARQFDKINSDLDNFGDFGLTNTQMLEGFAEFVDASRLSGNMDRLMANEGEGLRAGYTDLLKETSMLATVTAFSRKELISSTMEAMGSPDFAGVTKRIKEKVGEAQGKALQAYQITLTTLASKAPKDGGLGPELGNRLLEGLRIGAQNFENTGGTSFDFLFQDKEMLTAIKNLNGGEEFIMTLQEDIRNGVVRDQGKIMKMLTSLEVRNDEGILKTNSGVLQLVGKVNDGFTTFKNSNQKLANMTDEERKLAEEEVAKNVAVQGGVTQAMNSTASALLKAQNLLIPNMANVNEIIKNMSSKLGKVMDKDGDQSTASEELKEDGVTTEFPTDGAQTRVLPRPEKNMFGGDRQGMLWDKKYAKTHNPDGSIKQRFLGGYLGSKAMSMVGELGPEMLVTDMPTYVKTIDQIGRSLGEAISVHTADNGTTRSDYKGGYYTTQDGGGTNLFDKMGELLYNELSIAGLTRRTYGNGDTQEMFEGTIGEGNVTQHFFNGKLIGSEYSSGDMTVYNLENGAIGMEQKVSDSTTIRAGRGPGEDTYIQSELKDDNGELQIQTSIAPKINHEQVMKKMPDQAGPPSERMGPKSESNYNEMMAGQTDSDEDEDVKYMQAFRDALKNLQRGARVTSVRTSAEYE